MGLKDSDQKKLPIWGFLLLTVVYLAIIKGVGILVEDRIHLVDGKMNTVSDIIFGMWIPLGAAFLFVYTVVAILGWIRPVMVETRRVSRWVWFVPLAFALTILLGINYPGLFDKGVLFTLALLIGTQFVGWGEEGMFRGLGVTTLRQYKITEGQVALWSSVIFGLVHISNALFGGGPSAFFQAFAVMFAGYFFYLIRRVSGSNAVNSVLHGLFDFTIISSTGIYVEGQRAYIGSGLAIALYLIVGSTLLIRRHRIELPAEGTR